MDTMKPQARRRLIKLQDGPVRRGRDLFTHAMLSILAAANGQALGKPGYSLLGKYQWGTGGVTYTPNGNRERARRRRQIDAGIIAGSRSYTDSIDYGDGTWDYKEYVYL